MKPKRAVSSVDNTAASQKWIHGGKVAKPINTEASLPNIVPNRCHGWALEACYLKTKTRTHGQHSMGIIELDSCEGTCGRAADTATNFWWGLSYADATAAHKRTLTGFECIWGVSIHEGLQVALAHLHIIKEQSLGLGRGGSALQVPFLLNLALWKTFQIENSNGNSDWIFAGGFGNSWTERKIFHRVCDWGCPIWIFSDREKKKRNNTPWQPLTVNLED